MKSLTNAELAALAKVLGRRLLVGKRQGGIISAR